MARYSNSYYQQAYYGADISKLPGSVEPIVATAVDYSRVSLSWVTAPGAGVGYTALRVIRNQDEYPETEEDGVIIYEVEITDGAPPQTFEDGLQYTTIPLSSGRYVYYGIWIRNSNTNTWVEAGKSNVLLPKEHINPAPDNKALLTTHERFMNVIPKVYTSQSQSPIDEVDRSSAIYRFMSAFSFTLDETLTFIDLLLPDASGRFLNPNSIPAALHNLGLSQAGALVTKNQKRLIREAMYIYSRKATKLSLDTLVESVTGFAPVITVSPNLLLTNQDSTFNGGIGSWLPIGDCTITLEQGVYPPTTAVNAIDMDYTAKLVVGTAGAKITNGADNPELKGIPVTPGIDYGFSYHVRTATGTGSTKADILWYDHFGVQISDLHSPMSDSASTTWKRTGQAWTAPAKAAYASVEITFLNTGTYYLDMLQFANTADTSVYNEAREVSIFLQPKKSNFIENPSFYPTTDMDDTDWVLNGDAPAAENFVTPTTLPGVHDGSHMFQVVTTSGGSFELLTHTYDNMAPAFYTFSIYAQCPDGVESLQIGISAFDADTNEELKFKQLTPVIVGSAWERHQVTLDATNLTGNIKFGIEINGTTVGNTLNFDAAQLEASYESTDYFDGSVSTTGAVWEGVENDSYSHQYPNKEVKIPRLIQEVYNNLPINTPYRISLYGTDPIVGYTR